MNENEEQKKPEKAIKERSLETQQLVGRLSNMKVDETLTYQEMSDLVHGDVQNGHRCYLASARRIVEKTGVFTEAVWGIGIKRIPESEVGAIERDSTRKRLRRLAKRSAKRLGRVNYDALSEPDKRNHQIAAATVGAIAIITSTPSQKQIEQKVMDAGSLPPGDALKLFS